MLTKQVARRVSLVYLVAAGLWILLSDRYLVAQPFSESLFSRLSTYKGLLFVLVSSVLLYIGLLAVLRYYEEQQQAHVKDLERLSGEIRASEARFRTAILNSPLVVFSQDLDLRYTWVFNPLLPFEEMAMIGKTDHELLENGFLGAMLKPEGAGEWLRMVQAKKMVLQTGEGRREQLEFPLDSHSVFFDMTLEPSRNESGELVGVVGSAFDVTNLKRAKEQIESQVDRLAALRKIDLAITSSLDMQIAINVLLDQAVNLLKLDAAAVLLLNPQTQYLEFAYGTGFRTGLIRATSLPLGGGLAGAIAQDMKGIGPLDLTQTLEFRRQEMATAEEFTQYYGLPLLARGRIHGVLEVFNRSPREYNLEWLDFLESLAGQAAIAIDNFKLYEELQQTNLDISTAYDATLEGWSRALELRDQETDGHSRRVTQLAIALAVELGFRGEDLVNFRRGTLLHDIGKMGVPDSILLKPGMLDEKEWEIMRQHPLYAYDMLWPVRYLRPALDIPLYHHERWDGSGYPRGLSGEEIPLAARIFAVVDVWDALCSDRPYRPAWPIEQVKSYLLEQAGKQFDPRVVHVFMDLLAKNQTQS